MRLNRHAILISIIMQEHRHSIYESKQGGVSWVIIFLGWGSKVATPTPYAWWCVPCKEQGAARRSEDSCGGKMWWSSANRKCSLGALAYRRVRPYWFLIKYNVWKADLNYGIKMLIEEILCQSEAQLKLYYKLKSCLEANNVGIS